MPLFPTLRSCVQWKFQGRNRSWSWKTPNLKSLALFVNWLYTQDIIDEGRPASCSDCINLWILADKLLVPVLQNQALRQLEVVRISSSKKRSSSAIFHRVWDNTTEESPLRACLVEVMIRKPKRGNTALPGDYPHGMLVAMIDGMRSREWDRNLCDGSSQGSWVIPAEELMDYLVSEDVESRKVVSTAPYLPTGNDSGFAEGNNGKNANVPILLLLTLLSISVCCLLPSRTGSCPSILPADAYFLRQHLKETHLYSSILPHGYSL
jgi:hypothetical protein